MTLTSPFGPQFDIRQARTPSPRGGRRSAASRGSTRRGPRRRVRAPSRCAAASARIADVLDQESRRPWLDDIAKHAHVVDRAHHAVDFCRRADDHAHRIRLQLSGKKTQELDAVHRRHAGSRRSRGANSRCRPRASASMGVRVRLDRDAVAEDLRRASSGEWRRAREVRRLAAGWKCGMRVSSEVRPGWRSLPLSTRGTEPQPGELGLRCAALTECAGGGLAP